MTIGSVLRHDTQQSESVNNAHHTSQSLQTKPGATPVTVILITIRHLWVHKARQPLAPYTDSGFGRSRPGICSQPAGS